MDLMNYADKFVDLASTYGTRLLLAIITLLVGLWVINKLMRSASSVMQQRRMDDSLKFFLHSTGNILLKVMLVISVAGMVGIEMTSFIAVLGAAGLAVGMALSGTLQNFAGGVMILIFKPYKVGDFIEAQGHLGVVKEIQVFNTILKTGDNKTIIIPNAPLSTGSMINYSTESTRRVDFTFGVGYKSDIDKTKQVLQQQIDSNPKILREPESFIALSGLGSSSVDFVVRVWVNAEDYWPVYFDMLEKVKKAFDKAGIVIPYPQTDVHVYHQTN